MDSHIEAAIKQARKEGNKGVRGFVGGMKEHEEYSKLRAEGKLEVFTQRYPYCGGTSECLLMRKPKINLVGN